MVMANRNTHFRAQVTPLNVDDVRGSRLKELASLIPPRVAPPAQGDGEM